MTDTGQVLQILLVDDHALFREGLARLLEAEPGISVAAHCSSASDALRELKTHQIDVILLDLDLGGENGTDLLNRLPETGFSGKVLLVTAGVSESDLPSLIRKGIVGIFMKHSPPASLVQGIREAMQGKVWFDQDILQKAFRRAAENEDRPVRTEFTRREREVMSLVFEGLGNKQIAHRLGVSESAVKGSLQQLFTKTGVRTRSQLVRVALERYRDQLDVG